MSLRSMSKALLATLAGAALSCGLASNALAGDTTELIDVNTLEIDPSFSIGNMNKNHKPSIATDISIVYGVLDGFNLSAGIGFETVHGLTDGAVSFGIGALATPLDTDMIDLDVMVDFGFGVDGGYTITPGFEFNVDLDPDMNGIGFYLRFGLPIYGGLDLALSESEQKDLNDDLDGVTDPVERAEITHNASSKADIGLGFTVGAYFTIVEGQQLIVEGGATIMNLVENFAEKETEGFVSIGYNAVITDTFELTTELALTIPEDPSGDNISAAITIGGIFGMLGDK